MSCLTKAKLWLIIYWANVGLLIYAIVRLLLADQWGLGQTTPPMAAGIGALVSGTVTRYWQQASIVPSPADSPIPTPQPPDGDQTLMLDGRSIAVVRRGQLPDGSTVWYRTMPPPGFLTPWQRPHQDAGLLRPRTESYYYRQSALDEAADAIRLRH